MPGRTLRLPVDGSVIQLLGKGSAERGDVLIQHLYPATEVPSDANVIYVSDMDQFTSGTWGTSSKPDNIIAYIVPGGSLVWRSKLPLWARGAAGNDGPRFLVSYEDRSPEQVRGA